ncbi:DUF6443 domain-containing protein [Mucilaginibacter sp. HD30]
MKDIFLKIRKGSFLNSLTALLAFSACMFTGGRIFAQSGTRVTAPLTGTNMLGQYYNYSNGEIVFGDGFSSTPGTGESFEAYIYYDPCPPLTLSPGNENYVVTVVPRVSGITQGSQLANRSPCDVMQSIAYFDGLGRPLQNVQANASPKMRDVVQPMAYDEFGREIYKYLPYASTVANNGSYKPNALAGQQAAFYSGTPGVVSTGTPYAQTVFETSPLNRVAKQGAPGADWQPSAHPARMGYGVNAANDIRYWTVASNGNGASAGSNYYQAGALTADTVYDENSHASVTFTDKEGRVVAKKVQSGNSTWLLTAYIYDDFGNLRYVIPPIPTGTTNPTSFAESDNVFKYFIYGYHYDARQRLTEKKVPGKGWEYMVYNNIDQVVATQDSVLKGNNQWTYVKYDGLGRITTSGVYSSSSSRATLQGTLNGTTVLWESRTSSYSNGAWPTSGTTALTVNYYDDYSITGLPGYNLTGASTMSLPTASQTNVLGTSDMLWKVMVYDDLGRVSKSYAQHYLGGAASANNYDQIANTYSFTNQALTTERKHYKNNGGSASLQLTLLDTYVYDHMGRSTLAKNKVNALSEVIMSSNSYNEVGQLKGKGLHSENSGSSFLQDVAYTYNERGWLSTSNTSGGLFNESLGYNSGSAPQWNGNISQMTYGYAAAPSSSAISRTFGYTYDYLNRLTNAALASGTALNEAMTYDELGNIASLARGGVTYGTLGYAYTGNRLDGVTGTGFTTRSYSAYDGNGNAKSDGVSKTIDYNLLNLPSTLKVSGSAIATFAYDATGQKLRSVSTADGTREYIGGINYEGSAIKTITTAEGRITNNSGTYSYQYDLKDHLGNVRVTFDKNPSGGAARIIQQDEYYSFGLKSGIYDNSNGNRYLYNGKERQADLTDQYDYGVRFYDPVIGRFATIDRFAEKYDSGTPYHYGLNNPISNIDMNGDSVWTTTSRVMRNGNIYITRTTHITGKVLDLTDNRGADALASGLNARLNSSTTSQVRNNANGSKTYTSYNIDAQFSAANSANDVGKGDNVVAIIDKMLGKSADGVTDAAGVTNNIFGLVSYVGWTNPRNAVDVAYHEVGHQFGLSDYFDGDRTSPMDYKGGALYGGTRFNQNEMFFVWENNGGLYDIHRKKVPNTAIITNRRNTGFSNERSTNERPYKGPRSFGMRILLPIKNQ